MGRRISLAFVLLLPVTWAAAANPQKDNLDGTWLVESWEVDGKKVPDDLRAKVKLVLATGKFTFYIGDQMYRGTFKADATRQPKTIDVTFEDGPNQGKTLHGIYELDGDTLKNCGGGVGKERPTEFTSKEGSGQEMVVYKRQK